MGWFKSFVWEDPVMIFRIFKRAPPHIKCQFLGWNSALWCNLSSAGGSSFPRKFPNYANPQNIERFSFFIGLGNISTNNANICNNCCQLWHYGWTRRREIWRLLSILGRTLPPTKLCHNSDKDSKVHTKFEIIQGWVEISSSRVLFVRNLLKTGSNWTGTKTYFVKLN